MEKYLNGKLISRRNFLDWLLGTSFLVSAAVIGIPYLKFLFPPSKVMEESGSKIPVAKEDEILRGRAKTVLFKNMPVLLIHTPAGFVAVSGICTHMGCFLKWDDLKQQIACPCHKAAFDTNGAVIFGPPPFPLPSYRVEISKGRIYLGGG